MLPGDLDVPVLVNVTRVFQEAAHLGQPPHRSGARLDDAVESSAQRQREAEGEGEEDPHSDRMT